MPAYLGLDDHTRRVMILTHTFTTSVMVTSAIYAHLVIIPKLKGRLSGESSTTARAAASPSLSIGLLASLVLMAVTTSLLVLPLLWYGPREPEHEDETTVDSSLTSNIDFCEENWVHHSTVAEPANVASSLGSYAPLALLGLFGPPSRQWRGRCHSSRFVYIYSALLAIGIGSAALHSFLTAVSQAGDELPMLTYVAATSFCAIDIILYRGDKERDESRSLWLGRLVGASAAAAIAIYVAKRDDFTIFFIMLAFYAITLIFSVIWIGLGIDWESSSKKQQQGGGRADAGNAYRAHILLPLSVWIGSLTVAAIWTWVAEMLYCESVMHHRSMGEVVAPWIWNRIVHALWHFESCLVAWLLVQILLSAHGMQQGWGIPQLQWYGAPYVVFLPTKSSDDAAPTPK